MVLEKKIKKKRRRAEMVGGGGSGPSSRSEAGLPHERTVRVVGGGSGPSSGSAAGPIQTFCRQINPCDPLFGKSPNKGVAFSCSL